MLNTKNSTPTISHFTALLQFDAYKEEELLKKISLGITLDLKLNVVDTLSHQFQPFGKTVIFLLSESHLAIHTFPEYKKIHIDLVTCTEVTEEEFRNSLEKALPDNTNILIKDCNFIS